MFNWPLVTSGSWWSTGSPSVHRRLVKDPFESNVSHQTHRWHYTLKERKRFVSKVPLSVFLTLLNMSKCELLCRCAFRGFIISIWIVSRSMDESGGEWDFTDQSQWIIWKNNFRTSETEMTHCCVCQFKMKWQTCLKVQHYEISKICNEEPRMTVIMIMKVNQSYSYNKLNDSSECNFFSELFAFLTVSTMRGSLLCASWINPSSKPSWLKNVTLSSPTEG